MNVAQTTRYRLHTRLGPYPRVIFPIYRLFGLHQGQLVTASTDLVIEAFPRSATTFCYYALQHAQAVPVRIAFHVHSPAQVIQATRMGVPSLVLIRRPRDAVRSVMLRLPRIPAAAFLERYLLFYKSLEPYLDRVVVADFEDAISDYGAVIRRINAKYGTSFRPFEHTPENIDAVNTKLDERHARLGGGVLTSYRPNIAKEALKEFVDLSPGSALLARCDALYDRVSPNTRP